MDPNCNQIYGEMKSNCLEDINKYCRNISAPLNCLISHKTNLTIFCSYTIKELEKCMFKNSYPVLLMSIILSVLILFYILSCSCKHLFRIINTQRSIEEDDNFVEYNEDTRRFDETDSDEYNQNIQSNRHSNEIDSVEYNRNTQSNRSSNEIDPNSVEYNRDITESNITNDDDELLPSYSQIRV